MATNGSSKGPEDASKDDKSKPNAKEDDLDLLEDDDEFEEFETEDWSDQAADKGEVQWEDDWDDDDTKDDFSKQLRAELQKTTSKMKE